MGGSEGDPGDARIRDIFPVLLLLLRLLLLLLRAAWRRWEGATKSLLLAVSGVLGKGAERKDGIGGGMRVVERERVPENFLEVGGEGEVS